MVENSGGNEDSNQRGRPLGAGQKLLLIDARSRQLTGHMLQSRGEPKVLVVAQRCTQLSTTAGGRGGEAALEQAPAGGFVRYGRRAQPDHLLLSDDHTSPLQLSDYSSGWRLFEAEQVHGELHHAAWERECKRLGPTQTSVGLSQRSRQGTSGFWCRARQQHIEREQGPARPDADSPGRCMQVRTAQVGSYSTGADVRQRVRLAVAVEVHRDVLFVPHALAELPRELVGGRKRCVAEWNDRKYIRGSDPWMDTSMLT